VSKGGGRARNILPRKGKGTFVTILKLEDVPTPGSRRRSGKGRRFLTSQGEVLSGEKNAPGRREGPVTTRREVRKGRVRREMSSLGRKKDVIMKGSPPGEESREALPKTVFL